MKSTGTEPFKIRLAAERHAAGLAHELAAIDGIRVERNGDRREVVIAGAITDRVVSSVLDGLRRAVAGDPTATAWVFLDGREYEFESE
jgi:hypothetical protein